MSRRIAEKMHLNSLGCKNTKSQTKYTILDNLLFGILIWYTVFRFVSRTFKHI